MFTFVVIVAVLNLVLGMAVAVVATHDWPAIRLGFSVVATGNRRAVSPVHGKQQAEQVSAGSNSAADSRQLAEAAEMAALRPLEKDSVLPAQWTAALQAQAIESSDPEEVACHLVRMNEAGHRSRLMETERRLRQTLQKNADQAVRTALKELTAKLGAWMRWANDFLEHCKIPESAPVAACPITLLHAAVQEEINAIDSLQRLVRDVLKESNVVSQGHEVIKQLMTVFKTSHILRDVALHQLAVKVAAGDRLPEIPPSWREDKATGFPNRLGVEKIVQTWRSEDPSGKRMVSAALVELDLASELNERFGVERADRMLAAFAGLMETQIRVDRGDCVARVAGPSFFLLLADADVAGAKAVAERIRQITAASTFQVDEEVCTLFANCGVCEVLMEDTVPEILSRLQECIEHGKTAGRNHTVFDEGQGPVLCDSAPVDVKGRTIEVSGN